MKVQPVIFRCDGCGKATPCILTYVQKINAEDGQITAEDLSCPQDSEPEWYETARLPVKEARDE